MSIHVQHPPMGQQALTWLKSATVGGALLLGIAMVAATVSATLSTEAWNSTAQEVTSGTLSLELSDNGTGFTSAISNLVPGDTVTRFVTLSNTGSLSNQALSLGVTDANASLLSTDSTRGLHIAISQCSTSWVAATGACAGTTTSILSNTSMSTLTTTPALLLNSLAVGQAASLRIVLSLPSQTEVTLNGVPPASTIQGLTSNIEWRFTATQPTASNISS